MAKLTITCMVGLLIALMSTQIVKLYNKNQELSAKEASYEAQKQEEETRAKELEEQEKDMESQEYVEQEAHRYGLFYDDEIIYREQD
jgi:cell division protein DivIC